MQLWYKGKKIREPQFSVYDFHHEIQPNWIYIVKIIYHLHLSFPKSNPSVVISSSSRVDTNKRWVCYGLNCAPRPHSHVEILTPCSTACERTWRQGHHRATQVKMKLQSQSPIDCTSWESLKFMCSAHHCYHQLPWLLK